MVVVLNSQYDSLMPLLFAVVLGTYCIHSLRLSISAPSRALIILDCVVYLKFQILHIYIFKNMLSSWCCYWIPGLFHLSAQKSACFSCFLLFLNQRCKTWHLCESVHFPCDLNLFFSCQFHPSNFVLYFTRVLWRDK